MKATRLTVHRINQRTGVLPLDTEDCEMIVFRVRDGKVIKKQFFFHHREGGGAFLPGFTHYAVLPRFLK